MNSNDVVRPAVVVNGRRIRPEAERDIRRENATARANLDVCWDCPEFQRCTRRFKERIERSGRRCGKW